VTRKIKPPQAVATLMRWHPYAMRSFVARRSKAGVAAELYFIRNSVISGSFFLFVSASQICFLRSYKKNCYHICQAPLLLSHLPSPPTFFVITSVITIFFYHIGLFRNSGFTP
jgi:hypothetical protein